MIILPAIDIIGGKPVRLYQGDYDKQEVVASSVVDTAKAFEKAGAGYVHMVDLDGARLGRPVNHELIAKTAEILNIPVEVGGGIRTMDDIDWYADHGISRIILGTSALQDEALLKEALQKYPSRIAVGIDAKNGQVCIQGWMGNSGVDYLEFAKKMTDSGVTNLIFTDISRDGTLSGPNLDMLKALQNAVDADITASGGISSIQDIEALAAMDLYGAITGKAIYSGSLDLNKAIEMANQAVNEAVNEEMNEADAETKGEAAC